MNLIGSKIVSDENEEEKKTSRDIEVLFIFLSE
jgi:hypothetical protein